MSEIRKRRWFQLRLSTCVVLMIVAGFLLTANFIDTHVDDNACEGCYFLVYGWPFEYLNERSHSLRFIAEKSLVGNHLEAAPEPYSWDYWKLSYSVLSCLGILALSTFAVEYAARQGERLREHSKDTEPKGDAV